MGHSDGEASPSFGADSWVGAQRELPQTWRQTDRVRTTQHRVAVLSSLYINTADEV